MKHIVAYTTALALSIAIIFGAFKAEAHNDGAAIAGAAIGFGLGIAAGRHGYYGPREYFPTGPAFYPYNYYIPPSWSPYFGPRYYYAPRPIYRPYRRLHRYRY